MNAWLAVDTGKKRKLAEIKGFMLEKEVFLGPWGFLRPWGLLTTEYAEVGIDRSLMSEVGSLRFLAAENAEVAKIESSKWRMRNYGTIFKNSQS